MKLVEAELPASLDDVETPSKAPPRPPHRRVSVSLILTLAVLVGTVVTIYVVFPNRDDVLVTEAFDQHRAAAPAWELVGPSPAELRAWTLGVIGPDAPEVPAPAKVIGARRTTIHDRPATVARVEATTGDRLTILIQHALGIGPKHTRLEGDAKAITIKHGAYATIVVGPAATAARWEALFR